jgi:hypothetical protein
MCDGDDDARNDARGCSIFSYLKARTTRMHAAVCWLAPAAF